MNDTKNLLTEKELEQIAGGMNKNFVACITEDNVEVYVEESGLKNAKFDSQGRIITSQGNHGLEIVPRDDWNTFKSAAEALHDTWTITKDFKK